MPYGAPPFDEDGACQRIAQVARDAGRRVDVDPVLAVVLTECPHCHAERDDPQRIYLPMKVVPRAVPNDAGGHITTTFRCSACKFERVDVQRSL